MWGFESVPDTEEEASVTFCDILTRKDMHEDVQEETGNKQPNP